MDSKGTPQGAVPPYEPNPAYSQAPMQHHEYVVLTMRQPHFPLFAFLSLSDPARWKGTAANHLTQSSYNNNQINQYPPQQQYTPMSSPPIHDQPKQEYYAGQENNPTPIHPQQSMPVQQHQAQVAQAYQTATPIANLGEGAAPVDCPCCHMRALTKTEYHSGNTTKFVTPFLLRA
ncbi:MAG: hypothetical protein Q9192_005548 [Flavoplaca navasiana]